MYTKAWKHSSVYMYVYMCAYKSPLVLKAKHRPKWFSVLHEKMDVPDKQALGWFPLSLGLVMHEPSILSCMNACV